MKIREYVRRYDELSMESPIFRMPERNERLLKEIGRGKKVLDLGCLGGKFSLAIKDQNNEVFGVELNPKAAALAESRGIRVKQFDLADGIPFEDGLFDVVSAGELIDSVYDTKFLFDECYRVLKPQGIFLFTAPNLNSLSNRLKILAGGYPKGLGVFPEDHGGTHIRLFNLMKIQELCWHTGFRVELAEGLPAAAFPFKPNSSLRKILRPFLLLAPQLSEMLLVRARRLESV